MIGVLGFDVWSYSYAEVVLVYLGKQRSTWEVAGMDNYYKFLLAGVKNVKPEQFNPYHIEPKKIAGPRQSLYGYVAGMKLKPKKR